MLPISSVTMLFNTLSRLQSKTLFTIDRRGTKIARSIIFLIAIFPHSGENSVSSNFDLRLSIVLTFPITAYPVCYNLPLFCKVKIIIDFLSKAVLVQVEAISLTFT